jgi:hypothetical protein
VVAAMATHRLSPARHGPGRQHCHQRAEHQDPHPTEGARGRGLRRRCLCHLSLRWSRARLPVEEWCSRPVKTARPSRKVL